MPLFEGKEKGMRKVDSLAELPSMKKTVDVVVPIDGEHFAITLQRLSHKRWMEIEREEKIPDPKHRIDGATGEKVFLLDHPETTSRLNDRQRSIDNKRLEESITQEIPGVTLAEKANWLEEAFDNDTLTMLKVHMQTLTLETASAVVLAETFRGNRQT